MNVYINHLDTHLYKYGLTSHLRFFAHTEIIHVEELINNICVSYCLLKWRYFDI